MNSTIWKKGFINQVWICSVLKWALCARQSICTQNMLAALHSTQLCELRVHSSTEQSHSSIHLLSAWNFHTGSYFCNSALIEVSRRQFSCPLSDIPNAKRCTCQNSSFFFSLWSWATAREDPVFRNKKNKAGDYHGQESRALPSITSSKCKHPLLSRVGWNGPKAEIFHSIKTLGRGRLAWSPPSQASALGFRGTGPLLLELAFRHGASCSPGGLPEQFIKIHTQQEQHEDPRFCPCQDELTRCPGFRPLICSPCF